MDTKLLLPYWETIKDAIANAKMWLKLNWKPLVTIPLVMLVVSVFVLYYRNEAITIHNILGMTGALVIIDSVMSMWFGLLRERQEELFTLIPLLFGMFCGALSYLI